MKILGINALNHDAAITLIDSDNGKILFAAHAERYSGIKNDSNLNKEMFEDMEKYIHKTSQSTWRPSRWIDKVVYFERPWIKKLRQLKAGQYREVFSRKNLPQYHLDKVTGGKYKIDEYVDHHLSHASSTYFTSPYTESAVVVIDAIGEFDTISIWYAKGTKLEKRWSQSYPHSLGLWYSAMTQRLDLKPQEDEFILMGMAAWGRGSKELQDELRQLLNQNLHRGCLDWDSDFMPDEGTSEWKFDVAHNVQVVCEEEIAKVFRKAKEVVPETDNMCYSGGVALNCVANSNVVKDQYPKMWILPNPGDAGSSLGCAAYVGGVHLDFMENGAFLGYDIKGDYPIDEVLDELLKGNLVGVANGRAEYGPRALGNRSLLADPRGKDIKQKMNEIKNRQEFRPFAPSVLEEYANDIFDMPTRKSQFMQYVAPCKYPDKYPAICHIDNTSRVQTVSKKDNPGYYRLIKEFYKKTGCPMVLNTSLNIKGQPIVNDEKDADEFTKKYGVKVFR
jgi:carbamoyltransferase